MRSSCRPQESHRAMGDVGKRLGFSGDVMGKTEQENTQGEEGTRLWWVSMLTKSLLTYKVSWMFNLLVGRVHGTRSKPVSDPPKWDEHSRRHPQRFERNPQGDHPTRKPKNEPKAWKDSKEPSEPVLIQGRMEGRRVLNLGWSGSDVHQTAGKVKLLSWNLSRGLQHLGGGGGGREKGG